VLTIGALSLHQLAYFVGHRGDAGEVLEEHGHAYLATLTPVLALAALAASFAAILMGAGVEHRRRSHTVCFELRAAAFAITLLAIFGTQELVEGWLSAGHPEGAAALLAGGWMALPLALPIGALAAGALGGLERAEELIARGTRTWRRRLPLRLLAPRLLDDAGPMPALGLAFGFSRRPPPAAPPR
jgi:hypothetical protein